MKPALLRLLGPEGREVGFADDDDVLGSDAGLVYRARASGRHLLELRDVQFRGGGPFRLRVGGMPAKFVLKDAPGQVSEIEPNDNSGEAALVELGNAVVGKIEKPGDVDYFQFNGSKGEWATFRALSRGIGSPSHVYMKLMDGAGQQIADSGTRFAVETILRRQLPADGLYILRVEELLRRGGPQYSYRIETQAGQGGFGLSLKNGLDAKKKPVVVDRFWAITGQKIEINVQANRHGYEGQIALTLENGWAMESSVIKAKSRETKLFVSVPSDVKPGNLYELKLTGTGGNIAKTGLNHFSAHRIRWPHVLNPPRVMRAGVPVVIIEPVRISMKAVKLKAGAKVKARITALRPPPPLGAKPAPKQIVIKIKNLPVGLSVPDKIVVDAKKDFVEFDIDCATDAQPVKAEAVIISKSSYRGASWEMQSAPVVMEVSGD